MVSCFSICLLWLVRIRCVCLVLIFLWLVFMVWCCCVMVLFRWFRKVWWFISWVGLVVVIWVLVYFLV